MERFLKWFSNVILFSCIMAVAAFSPEYIKCSISIRFQDRNRVARGSPRSFINNLFSTRPIDEPDRDAHVPRHATLSFEPIIEPKSVITGESHPKLVPAPSSRPFLPCTTEQKVQQLFPPAAFSRTLFPCDCPSIGTRKRRSPSGISSIWRLSHRTGFHLGGKKKGVDVESEENREKERASFVARPPSDRFLAGNVQILIYRTTRRRKME